MNILDVRNFAAQITCHLAEMFKKGERPRQCRPGWKRIEMSGTLAAAALVMCGLMIQPAQSQVVGFDMASPEVVRAQLKSSPKVLVSSGHGSLLISVVVKPEYHLQSHHPLDKFLVPAEVTITPVKGLRFGKVLFPPAKLIAASPQITSQGKLSVYEGHFVITVPFHVSANAPDGPTPVHAAFTFQACNAQSCLPPQTLKMSALLKLMGNAVVPAKAAHVADIESAGVSRASGTPISAGGNSIVTSEITEINAQSYRITQVHEPLWRLVLFALLGGLILNIMPCVLPVIPLKVMAMVEQAHGSRRMAILHALVFSSGIITLFLILALIMGLYRALTGQVLTYGMQYQHPAFLIAMALIVLALALSMLGVWTIQPPNALYAADKNRGGLVGAYGMGMLATLLATPCSAPFLGVMLTWALVQPTAIIVLFFILIGVGMAWPYVLLAAFPAWLNRVPRAGRWSEIVREALGLVMVAVAVYLLLSTENRGQIVVGFVLAVIVAIVCWGWGRLPDINMRPREIWGIRLGLLAGGVLAGALYLAWSGGIPVTRGARVTEAPAAGRETFQVNDWQNFNLSRMKSALASGHPVVVDFTAPWCINCRFVKATVLDSKPVRQVFGRLRAVLLSADIDQPVPKALWLKLGGRAIPYLAILSPRHPHTPGILRDIYTRQDVIDDVIAASH